MAVPIPFKGLLYVYGISDTTTTGSTGANYYSVKAYRSGQDETGISYQTSSQEITAYSRFFLGKLNVSTGDLITATVTAAGTPSGSLSDANITLECELTPLEGEIP